MRAAQNADTQARSSFFGSADNHVRLLGPGALCLSDETVTVLDA
jgi:hypothetical protein